MKFNFNKLGGIEINAKILNCIESFVTEKFGEKWYAKNKFEFVKDDILNPGEAAKYICDEGKIILKYSDYNKYIKDGLNEDDSKMMFHTLAHEIQHSINSCELQEVSNYIENIKQLAHVKAGILILIDEFFAENVACSVVPGISSNMIAGLEVIAKDIALKKTSPINFYLYLLNVIPEALAEEKMEQKGRLDEVLKKVPVELANIVKELRIIIEEFDIQDYKQYVEKCSVSLVELLIYLDADFEMLEQL